MKFEIYKSGVQFGWRLKADNGEIIAQSEQYTTKANCQHAVGLVKSTTAATPVNDLTT
jgi:hypothetical protein